MQSPLFSALFLRASSFPPTKMLNLLLFLIARMGGETTYGELLCIEYYLANVNTVFLKFITVFADLGFSISGYCTFHSLPARAPRDPRSSVAYDTFVIPSTTPYIPFQPIPSPIAKANSAPMERKKVPVRETTIYHSPRAEKSFFATFGYYAG